jgi:two-component system chemotaxis sensor kinase CheA
MARDPYKYFRVEARELLDELEGAALGLEKGDASRDTIARMLRIAHTLKGASRVVKQHEIAELAHAIEGALVPFRDGETVVPPDVGGRILGSIDQIAVHVRALSQRPQVSEVAAA